MKKKFGWIILTFTVCMTMVCLYGLYLIGRYEGKPVLITRVITATSDDELPEDYPHDSDMIIRRSKGPVIIATAPGKAPSKIPTRTSPPVPSLTPTQHPTISPTPEPTITPTLEPYTSNNPTPIPYGNVPSPIPDYYPGRGMAVLVGESPFEVTIMRGGWQAYQIGPSSINWGYLVDITPLQPAVEGAFVEYKIMPEYYGGQWMDVLWLRAPGIADYLPVRIDLIPTQDWKITFEADVRLTPGDWIGIGMFSNAEGCGGVLDISPSNSGQPDQGAYIYNWRVQPEFPGDWIQVIRVQLSSEAHSQQTWLRYFAPGQLAQEIFRLEANMPGGVWSGWVVSDSTAIQGYVVEVIPLLDKDNEVAFSVVRPEFNGEKWEDVLRVYVPDGRPTLSALMKVLAVPEE